MDIEINLNLWEMRNRGAVLRHKKSTLFSLLARWFGTEHIGVQGDPLLVCTKKVFPLRVFTKIIMVEMQANCGAWTIGRDGQPQSVK